MGKKQLETALLVVADLVAIFIALQGAILVRTRILPYFLEFPEFPENYLFVFGWVFPVWFLFFLYEGLYTKRFSFWDEIKVLWKVVFFSTLAAFSILYLGKRGEQVSRTVLVLMGILSLPILPLIRINVKKLFMGMGLLKSKVLILGAGKTGTLILGALKRDTNLGFDVVGFLDDSPAKIGKKIEGVKVHGGVDKAEKYISKCDIHDVVIAMPGCEKEKLVSIINKLQHKARNILFIPDLFGMAVLGTNLQHFFQEQTIGLEVKNNLAKPANILMKRLFDVIVGCAFLIVLAVPMMIISMLIRLNSPGPAMFSQQRIGRGGKTFRCYKFRTMYIDSEHHFNSLLENNSDVKNEWEQFRKLKNDPRITKIGEFLRKTSLDELPQLFNVLKGEMSLVGPRPVTQREIEEYYKDKAELCFGVPLGITGLWQVSGRSNASYTYRIALDSWYVRNWNLWLDIVILFKTIRIVLKREGAY
jgi:undecaprenyl-phosphate galactose phosphotransferase